MTCKHGDAQAEDAYRDALALVVAMSHGDDRATTAIASAGCASCVISALVGITLAHLAQADLDADTWATTLRRAIT